MYLTSYYYMFNNTEMIKIGEVVKFDNKISGSSLVDSDGKFHAPLGIL